MNKVHIIYTAVIVAIIGVAFTFLRQKPKEKIVTVTKIQTVFKDRIVEKKVFVNKTITIRKKNGDVITETDHSIAENQTENKTQSQTSISSKTVEKFMSHYSIDTLYNLPGNSIIFPSFNYKNVEIIGGVRVFDLPVFALIGTDGGFSSVKIGLRLEF